MMQAAAHWLVLGIGFGGYWAVLLLMAAESACLPVPSEIVMPFAGYLVSTGRFSLAGVALAGAVGCNLGSTLAYAAGRYGGRALLRRYGRWLMVGEAGLDQAARFFARFGGASVFFGRLLPVVRTFIALPAGIGRMKLVPFELYTFLGSLPWCLALAWAGMRAGQAWAQAPGLRRAMHGLDAVVVGLALAGLALLVWRRLHRG